LKILLRFEVDACVGVANAEADDLSSAFSKLGIAANSKPSEGGATNSKVTIIRTTPRSIVPQSSLIELKTRASHRPLDWTEAYPQLYLSQTTYLYLAKHNRGSFINVEKVSIAGDAMNGYARQAEAGMGKLKAVLDEVLRAVRDAGEGVGLCLVCERGKLALYQRKEGTGKAVGKDILRRFTETR
jgi:hypothetical protein